LKGVYLALVVYRDPAARPMVDIDLLVKPEELHDVIRMLRELGYGCYGARKNIDYTTHQHLCPLRKPAALAIDLHRSLVRVGSPFDIDLAGLWQRAHCARLMDEDVLVPSPEDALLHSCVHAGYNHRFNISLIHLCDVVALLEAHAESLQWSYLVETAESDGRSRFLYATLAVVRRLFGAPVPLTVLERLNKAAASEEVIAAIGDYILMRSVQAPFIYRELSSLHSSLAQLRVLIRTIAPPPNELRRIYQLSDAQLVWPRYITRPFDLLARRGRFVAEMLCQTQRAHAVGLKEANRRLISKWIDESPRLTM
jgi:hypothetical protein